MVIGLIPDIHLAPGDLTVTSHALPCPLHRDGTPSVIILGRALVGMSHQSLLPSLLPPSLPPSSINPSSLPSILPLSLPPSSINSRLPPVDSPALPPAI